jgi:hypothetical protein
MSVARDFDYEGQMQELHDSIVNLHSDLIEVEKSLFHQQLWGDFRHQLGVRNAMVDPNPQGVPVSEYLSEITGGRAMMFSYIELGNKVHYYVKGGKVYICSAATAKKRWIEWWLTHKL